jgi:hypothetical protein
MALHPGPRSKGLTGPVATQQIPSVDCVTAAGGAWLDVSLSWFSLLLMGLTTIRFHVFGDNLAARTMYEKLGFIQQTW